MPMIYRYGLYMRNFLHRLSTHRSSHYDIRDHQKIYLNFACSKSCKCKIPMTFVEFSASRLMTNKF